MPRAPRAHAARSATARAVGARLLVAAVSAAWWAAAPVAPASPSVVYVTVDGTRALQPGPVDPDAVVVLRNEQVRLTLAPRDPGQRAGHRLELATAAGWREVSARQYGDWTYVGTSVETPPTAVRIGEVSGGRVSVTWEFGAHRVGAAYTSDAVERPYPFAKTIWLTDGLSGYHALVRPQAPVAASVGLLEHEIGYGGLFGPGVLSDSDGALRTQALTSNRREEGTAWAGLDLEGDGIQRVLVPLPVSPVLTPVFGLTPDSDLSSVLTPTRYGSVYVHRLSGEPYGAYLHAGPGAGAEVCARAVGTTPPELRALLGPDDETLCSSVMTPG